MIKFYKDVVKRFARPVPFDRIRLPIKFNLPDKLDFKISVKFPYEMRYGGIIMRPDYDTSQNIQLKHACNTMAKVAIGFLREGNYAKAMECISKCLNHFPDDESYLELYTLARGAADKLKPNESGELLNAQKNR